MAIVKSTPELVFGVLDVNIFVRTSHLFEDQVVQVTKDDFYEFLVVGDFLFGTLGEALVEGGLAEVDFVFTPQAWG